MKGVGRRLSSIGSRSACTAALREFKTNHGSSPSRGRSPGRMCPKRTPMSGLPECGPDGLVGQTFPADRLFVSDCAVGALLGRIGGSSASLKGGAAPASQGGESKPDPAAAKADDGPSNPFPVGSHTVIKLPADAIGPSTTAQCVRAKRAVLNRVSATPTSSDGAIAPHSDRVYRFSRARPLVE
jgi:hypothetical protein